MQTLEQYIDEGRESLTQITKFDYSGRDPDDEPPLVSVPPSEQGDEESDRQREDISDDERQQSVTPPVTSSIPQERKRASENRRSIDHRPLRRGDKAEPEDAAAQHSMVALIRQSTHDGDFVRRPVSTHYNREKSPEITCRELSLNDPCPRSPIKRENVSTPTPVEAVSVKKARYDTEPPSSKGVKALLLNKVDTLKGKVPKQKVGSPEKARMLAIRDATPAALQHDTIAQSPILSQFAIDSRYMPPDARIPTLNNASTPQSIGSPGSDQTLPSLTIALGVDSMSAASSPSPYSALSRTSSAQFGPPLTVVHSLPTILSNVMSPPNYAAGPNLTSFITNRGRTDSVSTDTTSASTPTLSWSPAYSPGTSVPTPHSNPSPPQSQHVQQLPSISHLTSYAPPLHTQSPNSTPIATPRSKDVPELAPVPADRHSAHDQQRPSSPAGATNANAPAPAAQILHTCPHPHCTSAPFATQYLLNSHLNVHSESRPHFCSVRGCARGPGGQGFKRKNEMIRHGLVHTSPGYTCPFCPTNGPMHKYPRPDNLQRHVRVHHKEVEAGDGRLRRVLGQARGSGGAGGNETGDGEPFDVRAGGRGETWLQQDQSPKKGRPRRES
ncbi:uncharacterized protein AB675_7092 [Cyphellophora attinorum]|uniref:C2H2-type domain-containing protein n=1 Tax=Cyphellophora attinorum TaxID=1664694 RepID=A0A0N1HV82_9EURO|nr:uncharacterized protein AB675_7092 [Phialophora attinorum]KPI43585.1 hypothetical protein AB675_7092 [Phialophora attinorum]